MTRLAGVPDELVGEMGRIYREEARFPTELVEDGLVTRWRWRGRRTSARQAIRALIAAGADEIVFIPFPPEKTEESVERIATELIPAFRG